MHMESEKFRRKAMKIAAACQGVVSVSLEGESKDQLVVTGDQVDCVCLTSKLRKKFCSAKILSVEDANTSVSNESGEAGGEKNMRKKLMIQRKIQLLIVVKIIILHLAPPIT
ncbi:hypothetical protein P8452_49069 [Trifolium repens]|nr:hypothetical protein P8452_49069 [Trifolium repens]